MEISGANAMYTSPVIQNEWINIFGDLIQTEIVNKVSRYEIFSVFY